MQQGRWNDAMQWDAILDKRGSVEKTFFPTNTRAPLVFTDVSVHARSVPRVHWAGF